ncbi:MAG: hypothetical protein GY798_33675 [Hyphomicrobiales bacterium]|nr:hypothetical protein [Hyphomicrobiales bacterium]
METDDLPGDLAEDETLDLIDGAIDTAETDNVDVDETIDDIDLGDRDEQDDEESEDRDDAESELDEIEYAGKRYAIPKELKDGFMMQADYTRKTQEVATTRKELEERQQAFEQAIAARQESLTDQATITNIDGTLAQYQKVDWAQYQQEDPTAAEGHWRQFQTLKGQRQQLADKISQSEQLRARKAQQETAKRVEETQQVLQRDIKGWGPDLAKKLTDFGLSQGFTQQQLIALNTDARAIRVLHKAYQADQLLNKRKKGRRGTGGKGTIKPLEMVSGKRSRPPASAQPSDRDSDAAWMKKRNAQLRKRNQA